MGADDGRHEHDQHCVGRGRARHPHRRRNRVHHVEAADQAEVQQRRIAPHRHAANVEKDSAHAAYRDSDQGCAGNCHPSDDRHVGEVEDRPPSDGDEIHHRAMDEPVGEVSQ